MLTDVNVFGGRSPGMSLVTCCREICSEQGGRGNKEEKKKKENSKHRL